MPSVSGSPLPFLSSPVLVVHTRDPYSVSWTPQDTDRATRVSKCISSLVRLTHYHKLGCLTQHKFSLTVCRGQEPGTVWMGSLLRVSHSYIQGASQTAMSPEALGPSPSCFRVLENPVHYSVGPTSLFSCWLLGGTVPSS